jgi:hypothetical protein
VHRFIVFVLAVAALPGCYLSHPFGDDPRRDAGTRDDGGTDPDFDAGVDEGEDGGRRRDAGRDAGTDGGRDGGHIVGVDAEPPLESPPDPSSCRIAPEIFPFENPIQEARWPDGVISQPSSVHVCSTPVVLDLDPTDGLNDPVVIFPSYATLRTDERGLLRIWNPRTHETITYPADEAEPGVLEATGNLAAGDLDGDGRNEIIGMGVNAGTYAFRHDGTLFWHSPFPTQADRGLDWARTIGTAISLADLEGDGTVEVIAGRNVLEGLTGERRFVGDSSLTTRGTNQFLGPIACVADLDGDGDQEVIAGRTAFRHDGTILWNQTELQDGLCAVAEMMPTSAGPEVVLVSRGYIYLLAASDGAVVWSRALEGRSREGLGGAPTVADFDGDGRAEIGIAHATRYGVYDLDCLGFNRPAGCAAAGLLWQDETGDDSSSGTGSSVFDFNGDGRAEVTYNDQYFFRVYDGLTGTTLFEEPSSSRTRTENPVIVDADNDGDAEIVFASNAEAFFIRDFWTDPGVEIWGDVHGRWVGARRIWNQHAYHVTNVEEDGTIASPEAQSWTVLNAYRQNIREGGDVLVVPDLWGGRGSYECLGGDRVRFSVRVQNWGLERVGANVAVAFYRGHPSEGERIGQTHTTRTLEGSGDAEVVTFETELRGRVVDYWAVVDDPADVAGGEVAECREANNQVLIWRPSCD